MTSDELLTAGTNGEGTPVVGATPVQRKGLFDRDWQKALIIQLAIVAHC